MVRIIAYSNKRPQADSLYLELNLLPLYKIVHHRIALIMHTYHYDMLPIALHDLYIKKTISFTNIGLGNIIYCMFQPTHTLKKSIYSSVLILKNLQSLGFEFNISFPKFKKAIKTYLLHNEIDIGYNS